MSPVDGSWPAKYPTRCSCCRSGIRKGTLIVFTGRITPNVDTYFIDDYNELKPVMREAWGIGKQIDPPSFSSTRTLAAGRSGCRHDRP